MLSFELDRDFIRRYMGQQPQWGPLGYVIYKRTYSRPIKSLYPRHLELAGEAGLLVSEEYWLTVTRVVEGTFSVMRTHCKENTLPWDEAKGQRDAKEMFRLMWEFKFLPPGRGLWAMGSKIVELKGGAALNNCAFVSTDAIDLDFAAPFCFLMDMSMLGVGVGGDTRGAGKVVVQSQAIAPGEHFVVEDNRESWVELLRTVLNSFMGRAVMPEHVDYSLVRPRGAPIDTFGGTASGPEVLADMVSDITALLRRREGQPIASSDIVDIFNLIGRCVVAGNARRSAEIMFGDPTDEAFLELKDPTKYQDELNRWRWASNNSIWAEVGQSYRKVGAQTAKNGEPGYEWLENARKYSRMGRGDPDWKDHRAAGGNPCLEQTLESFELCCLVETFPGFHKNEDEYLHTLKYAYMYAKAVTLVKTHDNRTNSVLLKNRRIGCSMSGIVQAKKKFGTRRFFNMCECAYDYIQELDEEYSDWLCIPRSRKTTSVKPSGTVSLLPGPYQVTPGIHYPKSRYYMRVIRFAKDSWMTDRLRASGYTCIDIDEEKEPNTCAVYFPVEIHDFDRSEDEVSMWEQLELAAAMQHHWADNQVSVTVTFDRDKEGHDIPRALELFETRLKGVSFLPRDDSQYDHMPYQTISKKQFEEAVARITPLDLTEAVHESTDSFCDNDTCTWKPKN
jgi:adenosylcobalamin-dependent ribonucleoside-triphosphate reductase